MKIFSFLIICGSLIFAIDYSKMSVDELLNYRNNTIASEISIINKILYNKISTMSEKQLNEFYKPITQVQVENPDLMGCEDPYCKTLDKNK